MDISMSDNKTELPAPATPSTDSNSPAQNRDQFVHMLSPELQVEKPGSARLAAALQEVADSLGRGEDRRFMVVLLRYRIDDVTYDSSGLTMALDYTPEIKLSHDGFVCTTFFPPDMLSPSIVQRHGIIKKRFGEDTVELVRVQVCVRSKDIYKVIEFKGAAGLQQRSLYYDPNVVLGQPPGSKNHWPRP
jgi:hypothetical protein